MSALAEKIRKAREFQVQDGDRAFTVRRPTKTDIADLYVETRGFEKRLMVRAIARFIVGWDGVTELDLWSGGTGAPAEFDAAACAEWLADRFDLAEKIAAAALAAYNTHRESQAAAVKN